jgi:hypothetical protein
MPAGGRDGQSIGRGSTRLVSFIDETWKKTNTAPLRGVASATDQIQGPAPPIADHDLPGGVIAVAVIVATLRTRRV